MDALAQRHPLRLTNTLTRSKEAFEPLAPPAVGLYVCGPTVYGDPHLGHARSAVTFDLLTRYLRHLGYTVRYVRNITDVGHLQDEALEQGEDKIARKARLEKLEPMEVAQRYTNRYHDGMDALNCLRPSIEPTASGHIPEQIAVIRELIAKGFAYESCGSVYFDLGAYSEKHTYGTLSGKVLEELQADTRGTAGQQEKRHPFDFALWKKAEPSHIMRWDSPWGEGFPGWHIECTAMSTKYLGETFDIHGGGLDLQFPHHEAEIAQSCGAHGHGPARLWMHHNMVTMDGAKMSKSAGNFVTLDELFTGSNPILERAYRPMAVRFLMLQSHYQSPIDFSNAALQAAEKGLDRLLQAVELLAGMADEPETDASERGDAQRDEVRALSLPAPEVGTPLETELVEACHACYAALSDDLNTAQAVAAMFELSTKINALHNRQLDPGHVSAPVLRWVRGTVEGLVYGVLGLKLEKGGPSGKVDGLLDLILELRAQARGARDFRTSDRIRDALAALGFRIKDVKGGGTEVEFEGG